MDLLNSCKHDSYKHVNAINKSAFCNENEAHVDTVRGTL